MPERCFGQYVQHPSAKYPQCTNDAVFQLAWLGALPREEEREWKSWTCAHHVSQVIRWALSSMAVENGTVTVKNYPNG